MREVARFDPDADQIQVMGAVLESGRYYSSAAWGHGAAYIFGGWVGGWVNDEVWRYDPVADVLNPMNAKLPTGRYVTTAAWLGDAAYVFGGWDGEMQDEILRFDPESDTLTVMESRLPWGMFTKAASDGHHIYLFGGRPGAVGTADYRSYRTVMRYDPVLDLLENMSAMLPSGGWYEPVWDGRTFVLMGGEDGSILRYDPQTDQVHTIPHALTPARGSASAVFDGRHAYLLGGSYNGPRGKIYLDDVVRVNPFLPGTPTSIRTSWAEPGVAVLSWNPPEQDLGLPVTSYRVYAGDEPGEEVFDAEVEGLSFREVVQDGVTRSYRVQAVNERGAGRASEVLVTLPPSQPRNLTAEIVLGGVASVAPAVRIAWEPPSHDGGSPVTNYIVYRSDLVASDRAAAMGQGMSWTDPYCVGDCEYYVVAENESGRSLPSRKDRSLT